MEINYRRVKLSDQNEMQTIAAIDMTIPALFDSMFEVNDKTIAERLEQLLKCQDSDFFDVAVTMEGRIIGYHFLNRFTSPHGLPAASVQTLWVDPEYRRKGIAKALKARGEAWAVENGLDHISTFVHAKNAAMQILNQNFDYELVGYKLRKNINQP